MKYDDLLKRIRDLEKAYGIIPISAQYIDSLEERENYLEWLLNDGAPYSVTPIC